MLNSEPGRPSQGAGGPRQPPRLSSYAGMNGAPAVRGLESGAAAPTCRAEPVPSQEGPGRAGVRGQEAGDGMPVILARRESHDTRIPGPLQTSCLNLLPAAGGRWAAPG